MTKYTSRPFKRITHTYMDGRAWIPAAGLTFMGEGELVGEPVDRLALYEAMLQVEPAEAAALIKSLQFQLSEARLDRNAEEAFKNHYKAEISMSRRRERAAVVESGVNPDGTIRYVCPNAQCGHLFWDRQYVTAYCPDCGQALSSNVPIYDDDRGPQEAGKGEAE